MVIIYGMYCVNSVYVVYRMEELHWRSYDMYGVHCTHGMDDLIKKIILRVNFTIFTL